MRSFCVVTLWVLSGADSSCQDSQCDSEKAEPVSGDALLVINRARTQKKHTTVYRDCTELGMGAHGKVTDTDNVWGCSNRAQQITLWGEGSSDPPKPSDSSKEACWTAAGGNPGCGSRVMYHKDGLKCICMQENKFCPPTNMPSFVIAECECGFHPAKECTYDRQTNNAPKWENTDIDSEDCFDYCTQNGGPNDCCQFRSGNTNNEKGHCRLYEEDTLTKGYGTPEVIDTHNQGKSAFALSECSQITR